MNRFLRIILLSIVVIGLWGTARVQTRVIELESKARQKFGYVTEWSYQVDQHLLEHKGRIDTLSQILDLSVMKSCGIITNDSGHGSCVAISPNLILTAGHCIEREGCWIEIGGVKYEIIEKWKSDKYDVGFAKIEGVVPYVVLGKMPELMQTVYKIGFPVQRKLENFIAVGVVANLDTSFAMWNNVIVLDSPGIGGQSGCGVFNVDGELVAIHVGHISYGFGVEEPISHIKLALVEYQKEVKADVVEEAWGY